MSIILNIDSAIDIANISIAANGEIIASSSNTEQKDHGAFLQPAIQSLLKKASISIGQLDAIALSAGPGSYTGLRVGMASAKGLCYALNKPLITIGTLEIMAFAAILQTASEAISAFALYCPMIDARRMEVFTALYDQKLQTVLEPSAVVLDQDSFANRMLKNQIIFFGNGAKKWELLCNNTSAVFLRVAGNSLAMSILADKKFRSNDFASLAYSEPLYVKEFFEGSAHK